MSLREELSKQILAMAFADIVEDDDGIRVVPKPPWYELAADECIRQMRWTWHAARWSSPATMGYYNTVLEDGDVPGLAPEGWDSRGLDRDE